MGRVQLDRRVQIHRSTPSDDGLSSTDVWAAHGEPLWASKTDVSDGERARAGGVSANLTSRYVVYSTEFTRKLSPKDRIEFDGEPFEIFGIKTVGRDRLLEITAGKKVDG